MALDTPSIRNARREDAPLLAAAERAIASVPGMLASRPDEIDDDAVREMIIALDDRGRGNYLVAEHAGTVVGHAFLESLSLAATSALFIFVIVAAALKARHRPVVSGREQLIGSTGVMLDDSDVEGWARVHSEHWRVRTPVPLKRGQQVRVTGREGLVLTVAPLNSGA